MGAQYNFMVIKDDGKPRPFSDVKTKFDGVMESAAYDYGHAGYTGSWAECDGIVMKGGSFGSADSADEWLQEKAEKWGPALAVRIPQGWAIGAWCSS